ncbi:Uncharacterised protein [Mycobacterium tuberculosis]|nr:Uncharacterised protein [Mycobacterium tuberculosis]
MPTLRVPWFAKPRLRTMVPVLSRSRPAILVLMLANPELKAGVARSDVLVL